MADKTIKKTVIPNEKAGKVIKKHLGGNTQSGDIKSRWWNTPDAELFMHVKAVVEGIKNEQNFRGLYNLRYAKLYANREIIGFGSTSFDRSSTRDPVLNRVTYNVVKATTDTVASKIGKMKPRAMVLTSGGNFGLQSKAKKLTKYLDGAFEAAGTYEEARKVFVDACIFGTGALKVFFDTDELIVKTERVFIDEIIVDDADGIHGQPRQMHQKRVISRDQVMDMFPDQADLIAFTNPAKELAGNSRSSAADQIDVIESWHLPSGNNSGDGKHTITIDNATLLSEEYTKDCFPFVFFKWSEPLLGFFGTGIAEELVGLQLEINKLLRNIQQAQHLSAVPRVFIESASNVVSSHINNTSGNIIKYVGTPPIFDTARAMTPEVYQHLEQLYRRAFEIVGISQLSATSQKPSGLDSGVALRTAQDIETERFALTTQRFEEMFIDVAELMIDISKDMFEDFPEIGIKVKGQKFIETIKWKDVDMDEDKYVLRTYPTSLLPTTPAGRLQTVQEMIQAGFIDKNQALSLLDFPDIESVNSLENAAIDDINKIMEVITEEGRYVSPEPFMDLNLALKTSQSTYLRSKVNNLPENRLDLLRRFMEDVITLQQAQAPTPEEQAGQVAIEQQVEAENNPQAQPEDLPVSDLLPLE